MYGAAEVNGAAEVYGADGGGVVVMVRGANLHDRMSEEFGYYVVSIRV